jgi:hypothetical protein
MKTAQRLQTAKANNSAALAGAALVFWNQHAL